MRPAYAAHPAWNALEARLARGVAANPRQLKRRVKVDRVMMADIVVGSIIGTCFGDLEISQDVHCGVLGLMAQSQVAIVRQAIAERQAAGTMNETEARNVHDRFDGAIREFG